MKPTSPSAYVLSDTPLNESEHKVMESYSKDGEFPKFEREAIDQVAINDGDVTVG